MPTTYAIPDGRTVMAATLYTGTGATQSISNAVNGVSFQPDLVWAKLRSTTGQHVLYDSVRTAGYAVGSSNTSAESYASDSLTSFNSNGFSLGVNSSNPAGAPQQNNINGSTYTYVGWQWKAGTTSSSNTNGSITSTVSVGATQGFSVVTATSPASAGTVGHGLGVTPNMIIFKDRTNGSNYWLVWHSSFASATQGYMVLNTTAAYSTSVNAWNNTAPTSTTFSTPVVGTGPLNSGDTFVAYCFAAVAGYSAFGSYTGNGSTDGTFVYLGFRPRFIMVKDTTNAATDWVIFNTSSEPYNVVGTALYANSTNAESTNAATWCDILSNGFKNRRAGSANTSGATIIYAAFAENPFKYANAR